MPINGDQAGHDRVDDRDDGEADDDRDGQIDDVATRDGLLELLVHVGHRWVLPRVG
jgi:hypothetical protein